MVAAVVALLAIGPSASAGDCCRLDLSWHAYAGAYFESPRGAASRRTRARIETALRRVTRQFERFGICPRWRQGPSLPSPARLRLFGDGDTALARIESALGGQRPVLLFVERLEAFVAAETRYESRWGATLRTGGPLAIVALDSDRALSPTIRNELYHLLGLDDRELGASDRNARHVVRKPMWAFLRRTCALVRDEQGLAAAVAAKEECLATSPGAAACYADGQATPALSGAPGTPRPE